MTVNLLEDLPHPAPVLYDSEEIPITSPLPHGARLQQLVTQDESISNTNNSSSYSWKAGTEWLKPKSRGKGLIG